MVGTISSYLDSQHSNNGDNEVRCNYHGAGRSDVLHSACGSQRRRCTLVHLCCELSFTVFAERIDGPDVRVVFPAPAEDDPGFWKPSPEQIAAYQKPDPTLHSTDQFKHQEISEDIMNFISKVSPTFYTQIRFEALFVRLFTFNV